MTDNMNVTVTEEDIRKVEMHVDTTMYDDVSLIEHFAASTGMAFIDVEREFEAKEAAKREVEEAKKKARIKPISNEEAVMEALDEVRHDGPGKDFVR